MKKSAFASGIHRCAAAVMRWRLCNRCICIHRLRIPHIRLIIFVLDTGKTYSEKTDGCDDAPVLCACETLDGAARKAGLGGAATLSVQLLGSHYIEAVLG
jgi:hypothetical protein